MGHKARIARPMPRPRWVRLATVAGPGLVVMLADTDAGSIITAAQSGAQWGYHLLLLQLVLVPILVIVQELTVRLGTVSGKSLGELIHQHYGHGWALLSAAVLFVACMGALLSEMSGLVGVGLMFAIPAWAVILITVAGLTLMAYAGSYLSVERIAMAIGAFELVFLVVAWLARPDAGTMASEAVAIPWRDPTYLYLVAANIGAVIMPWMVFYQQAAVVEKKLTPHDLGAARWDTVIGAIATQAIMAAVLIATSATLGRGNHGAELRTVQEISQAIIPFLGQTIGRLLFAMGIIGSALVATIVVTLTLARTIGEVMGVNHSLRHTPREAPWFYGIYIASLGAVGITIMSGVNLVRLSVAVQVVNALVLPLVLAFLYLLARRLPDPFRVQGRYAAVVAAVAMLTSGIGVYASVLGILR